jgi:hypothetical protein
MTLSGTHGDAFAGYEPNEAVLIEDEELMQRADEVHSGEFERENHPDRCPGCGNIEPGSLVCRRCGHRLKRSGKAACFCFHEMDGAAQHQDALARVVSGATREEDGGVREWVTAIIMTEPANDNGAMAVHVKAAPGLPPDFVGYVRPADAAAIRKALSKARMAPTQALACKALIQGGVSRRDGSRTAYGIRLLLPVPRDIPRAVKAASVNP